MPGDSQSYAVSDLSWIEVEAHLARDTRLILPVGACDQFGPHLPIGSATLVAEALADDLSREFGVLRAPTLGYGVNVASERIFPGAAGIGQKSLHRVLNELLAAWEGCGISELIAITAQAHDPHVEAVATVAPTRARVRVVDTLAVNLVQFLDGPPAPQHGGEVITSLMLHLRPDLVRMDTAQDCVLGPDQLPRFVLGRLPKLPTDCPGVLGSPSLASADKGRRIYAHILQKIRERIFIAPPDNTWV